ncbi:hypothetical protein P3T76_003316 [Phytophthora citrophthora]|uniref:RxLR effector protein n=1 Tax=Phytophthora citrophthora TaxID=4793 RepID=A0AAD9LPC6_9STRA|nr:hypothetical protein P3T76_003316 [Phytophthora citrophthora]
MRLSYFLTVLVVTFVASIGFAYAESFSTLAHATRGSPPLTEDREDRDIGSVITTVISSLKGKLTSKLAEAAKLGDGQAARLSKILTNPDKARAALKVSDDEIAQMATLIKKANAEAGRADDQVTKYATAFAAMKKGAKASDEQVSSMIKFWANGKRTTEALKASDDEVRKVSDMFKTATGRATGAAKFTDDEVAKLSKGLVQAQKGAALTDRIVNMVTEAKQLAAMSQPLRKDQVEKLALELVPVA